MATSMSYGIPSPAVPFIYGFPGPIPDCGVIIVDGYLHSESQGFAICLQSGPSLNPKGDVHLHLGFSFTHSSILTVNTITMNKWETPLIFPNCPIRKASPFQLMIQVQRRSFMIALNGQHFCEFQHRKNPDEIRYIAVDGMVTVNQLLIQPPGGTPQSNFHTIPVSSVAYPGAHAVPQPNTIGGAGGSYPTVAPEATGAAGASAPANSLFYPATESGMQETALKEQRKAAQRNARKQNAAKGAATGLAAGLVSWLV